MPHSSGDCTPAGRGTCEVMTLNISPMKPSGVHDARPTVPPGRVTRTISSAVCWWSGANIVPKTTEHASTESFADRQFLGVAEPELDVETFGDGAGAAVLEQCGDVVDADRRGRRIGRPPG